MKSLCRMQIADQLESCCCSTTKDLLHSPLRERQVAKRTIDGTEAVLA